MAESLVRSYLRVPKRLEDDVGQYMKTINLTNNGDMMGIAEIMLCQLNMEEFSFSIYSNRFELDRFLYNSDERRTKHINIFYFEELNHFVYIKTY